MSKRPVKKGQEPDFSKTAKEVIKASLYDEMEESYLSYSYLSIEERALPDARDGMKPVQRRILYSMQENGNVHNKPYVKSARIVGNTMGVYHPHGDSAIYDAMVRMAQDFSLAVPLVDGKGNFGDRPGAGAASSRYTEARLSPQAEFMTAELKEKSVDFIPNYDESTVEPTVLPAQFPNLLVNGTSGIAVGYATEMPPHNPGEVLDAARWLLTHPNADVDKLMEFVPGPDFPTGCNLVGVDGIRSAYETGRGKFLIRAPYEIVSHRGGKSTIEFYELPYQVNSEKVLEQIKKAIKENKIEGIADAKDLTDRRNGTRLVIDTKKGFRPEAVLLSLYKVSDLESSYNFNNNALVNGSPVMLGLKDLLQIFLDHRVDTVTKRTEHRLDKRETRLHLVEGLLKALLDIDAVIKIVRGSPNAGEAKEKLIKKFKVDDVQAEYILSLQLRRLTKYDQNELDQEKKTLQSEITELKSLLNDEKKMKALIGKELLEVKKYMDVERRSSIIDGKQAAKLEAQAEELAKADSLSIQDLPCFVYLTPKGNMFRADKATRKAISSEVETTTMNKIVVVTNKGNAFRMDAIDILERESKASSYVDLSRGEKVIAVVPLELPEGKTGGIAMGTRKGIVKIAAPQWPVKSDEFSVMKLDGDDEIISARWVEDHSLYDMVFVKSSSNLLSFPADKVRPQGLSGGGMAGVKIAEGERVLDFRVVSHAERGSATVVTVSDAGNGKVGVYSMYPQKGRATGGVRTQAFLKGDTEIVFAEVLPTGVLYNNAGQKVEVPLESPKRDASGKPVDDELKAMRS